MAFKECLTALHKIKHKLKEDLNQGLAEREEFRLKEKQLHEDEVAVIERETQIIKSRIQTLQFRWLQILCKFHYLAYNEPTQTSSYRKLMDECYNPDPALSPRDPFMDILLPSLEIIKRREPLTRKEWEESLDAEGRVKDIKRVKQRITEGGVEPELRKTVWKFLLDYFPWDSSHKEREALRSEKQYYPSPTCSDPLRDIYTSVSEHWALFYEDENKEQLANFGKLRKRVETVERDIMRKRKRYSEYTNTLLPEGSTTNIKPDVPPITKAKEKRLRNILVTHSWYKWSIGYTSGMNKLLEPIYNVMGDEEVLAENDSFWCFVGKTKRMARLLEPESPGIRSYLEQLTNMLKKVDPAIHNYFMELRGAHVFICYRWFFYLFAKEFSEEQTMRIWEMLWAHSDENFAIWIGVAMFVLSRDKIFEANLSFEDIFSFMQNVSLDAEAVLEMAQTLYTQFVENGYEYPVEEAQEPVSEPAEPIVEPDTEKEHNREHTTDEYIATEEGGKEKPEPQPPSSHIPQSPLLTLSQSYLQPNSQPPTQPRTPIPLRRKLEFSFDTNKNTTPSKTLLGYDLSFTLGYLMQAFYGEST